MSDDPNKGLTDVTRLLRVAARNAKTPTLAAEWSRAADTLDNAIRLTNEHGDAPTRDALSAALGNAELGLDIYLRGMGIKVDQTHLDMQQCMALVSSLATSMDGFQKELRQTLGEATQDLGAIKKAWAGMGTWQAEKDVQLETLSGEVITIRESISELDQRHGGQWEEVHAAVEHLSQRLTEDEGRLDKKRLELDAIHQENAAMREEIAAINEHIASNRRAELDELKQRVTDLEARLRNGVRD